MSLRSEAERLTRDISIHLPPELFEEGLEARRRLVEKEKGRDKKAVGKGDPAPAFSLPTALSDIIGRLLEKKPEDRYQSAADLVSALQNESLK